MDKDFDTRPFDSGHSVELEPIETEDQEKRKAGKIWKTKTRLISPYTMVHTV